MFAKLATASTAGLDLLRLVLCAIVLTHGVYRFNDGTTAILGDILAEHGFPHGLLLASLVNLAEAGGALLILLGICAGFATLILVIIYVTGIILFHGHHGFFVIQPGNGGWEYSALLIVCLAVTQWSRRQRGFLRLRATVPGHGPAVAGWPRVFDLPRAGLDVLRIAVCAIILVHGAYGLMAGATPELGTLPQQLGPLPGQLLVLAVNLACVIAPMLVLIRVGVTVLSSLLIAVLFVGIVLWHAGNGFFVVGPGDDGWEFSALLITGLLTTIWANWRGDPVVAG